MDAITLAAVRRELDEVLTGGRVQAVLQPDVHSLALELFRDGQRQWLLLSANVQWPRVHLLAQKARRGPENDSPFLLQARKRLRGARLTHIIQPQWERLLYLTFVHHEQGQTVLVAEIMGRWSNLVLNDEQGDIIASLRHFEHSARSRRVIRPKHPYTPPPSQPQKLPIALTQTEDVARLIHQTPAGKPLWRTLVQSLAGLSPLAARELIFRATGDALADVSHPNLNAEGLMAVLHWLRSLPEEGGWAPTIAMDVHAHPHAFAPYELTHLEPFQHYPSISKAAQVYYAAVVGHDSYAGRRQQVLALIEQARQKLMARRASLGAQAAGEEDVMQLRTFGEWILAYAWQIKPGDTVLLADTGEETLEIPLNPMLSASENAQAYFVRYQKKKRAAEKIPALLAETDRDLTWLMQIESDVHLADNTPQIEELREALLSSGLISKPRKKRPRLPHSRPIQVSLPEGFDVIIGRNALQNEHITWKIAQADDIWLHIQGRPGSHVIIRSSGRKAPAAIIEQAAAWAAWHSQARHETKADVIVTRKRHLRKIKGGRPGQVQVRQYRTITVRPAPPPHA